MLHAGDLPAGAGRRHHRQSTGGGAKRCFRGPEAATSGSGSPWEPAARHPCRAEGSTRADRHPLYPEGESGGQGRFATGGVPDGKSCPNYPRRTARHSRNGGRICHRAVLPDDPARQGCPAAGWQHGPYLADSYQPGTAGTRQSSGSGCAYGKRQSCPASPRHSRNRANGPAGGTDPADGQEPNFAGQVYTNGDGQPWREKDCLYRFGG